MPWNRLTITMTLSLACMTPGLVDAQFADGPISGNLIETPIEPQIEHIEYQYQMYFNRPWMNFPGPGLSLGGALPAHTSDSFSSLYGLPFAGPLGQGVYNNSTPMIGPAFAPTFFPGSWPLYPRPLWYGQKSSDHRGSPKHLSQSNEAPQTERSVESQRTVLTSQTTEIATGGMTSVQSIELGDESLARGDLMGAYARYRAATFISPQSGMAHLRLGIAAIGLQEYGVAIKECKQALTIEPELGSIQHEWFNKQELLALRTEIRSTLTQWVKQDIKNADRLFLLGMTLYMNQDARGWELLQVAHKNSSENKHLAWVYRPGFRRETPKFDDPQLDSVNLANHEVDVLPSPSEKGNSLQINHSR